MYRIMLQLLNKSSIVEGKFRKSKSGREERDTFNSRGSINRKG
jgi:hypothetical protein